MVATEVIREYSIKRVASIFDLLPSEVKGEYEFGKDLRSSYVSDFRYNEFDLVLHDIEDVANGGIGKEFSLSSCTIKTVNDYCNYMVKCHEINPETVELVLGLKSNAGFLKKLLKLLGNRYTFLNHRDRKGQ